MNDTANGHPRELLSAYLDDELGLAERASIDRHLAACEDCRTDLDALRRLSRAVADLGVPPLPLDLTTRIGRRVDAGGTARPRKFSFVVPATIAATLGAIGILVALQWREGRLGPPVPRGPMPERQARDETTTSNAPSSPPVPENPSPPRENKQKSTRRDADKEDLGQTAKPTLERSLEKDAPGASGGVPGGVVGGVLGGAPGGAPADEARRDRAVSSPTREAVGVVGSAHAPAAKSEALAPCEDRWFDSGVRGTWEVADVASAARVLDRIARDVGGIGSWRGVADGRPYVLVVPRERFEEVYYALSARGVGGLGTPPTLAEGGGCAGISVALAVVPSSAPPLPR